MTVDPLRAETVDLLKDLGLKEYEARCFLALSQVPAATAKEISDVSEVPRTRVYDAVHELEEQGLVAVQHGSPKRFRAVDVDEATATLRRQYDDQIDTLQASLERLDADLDPDESDRVQEVWSLTGRDAVRTRTLDLVERAEEEVVLVVGDATLLTDALVGRLRQAVEGGASVVVGGRTAGTVAEIESRLPGAEVFETELDWLVGPDQEVAIGRLLLVDRTSLLVGSYYPADGSGEPTEQAIYATGLRNGIVVLIRRLVATGLLPARDPGQ